jgi:hypothetical protein
MSDIPFVQALGDALDHMIAADIASHSAKPRRRFSMPPGRARLFIALAALAVAGGAVAATLQNSTRLAAGAANCSYGTSDTSSGIQGVSLDGLSPVAACLRQYRRDGPVALTRPGVRFIACQQSGFYVDVMVADGRPDQCRRLGLSPLPATYTASADRVRTLERALAALQRGHDCIAPAVLESEVRGVLARLGFAGWRPELNHPPLSSNGGPCGLFPGTDNNPSDAYQALNPTLKVVMLGTGPPLSTARIRDQVLPSLITNSGRRCLSLATARALAGRLLAPRHFSAKFAVTAELFGEQFNHARQVQYNNGCTVIVDIGAARSGPTMDVWLNARSAPALPHGQAAPPTSAYLP